MKSLAITSNDLIKVFEQLNAQLGGVLSQNSNEFILAMDNNIAIGSINGFILENGIFYLNFNLKFKNNVCVFYKMNNLNPIHFGYCSYGSLKQSFNSDSAKNRLGQFQTAIFTNSDERSTYFYFKANQLTQFSLITVDVSNIQNREIKNQLYSKFFKNKERGQYSYVSSVNLKIAEKLEQLNTTLANGFIKNFLSHSLVYLILTLQLEQNYCDENQKNDLDSNLSKSDLETIREIANTIKKRPEIAYNLKVLCRNWNVSPNKLQQGFKMLYDRTVADYIRNVRVEQAENLIRTSDLNISEIVYSIGLSSRSYFSKIFKKKYKCSPKDYKNSKITNRTFNYTI